MEGADAVTVTNCVPLDWLLLASVAVQVMVVLPRGKMFPAGTPLRVMVAQPQLSVAVAAPIVPSLTNAVHDASAGTVTFAGTWITGAELSAPPGVRSTLTKLVFMFGVIRSILPSQFRSTAATSFGCQCELRHVGPSPTL